MKIDAHQHFWALARGDYGWLTPDMTPIYRDFSPDDLAPALRANGIDGTVLIQAAPTVAETRYMLDLADRNAFILGVVGWVDFEAADAPDVIADLARHPKIKGLRPMIQDIADPDWMLRPALEPALAAMKAHGLTFDALTLPIHLKNLKTLIDRHPDLTFVIDHASKPYISEGTMQPWAQDMADIATASSIDVKLSALPTEAGRDWTDKMLKPYVDHLLDTFGPDRMIWGSDWPVCTYATSYDRWCATTQNLLSHLSPAQIAAIEGGNALRAYNLKSHA